MNGMSARLAYLKTAARDGLHKAAICTATSVLVWALYVLSFLTFVVKGHQILFELVGPALGK